MKKKVLRVLSLMLVGVMTLTLIGGCSGKKNASNQEQAPEYELKKNVKLTYWFNLSANHTASMTNLGESPFFQEVQKRTGVTLEFLHPAASQAKEQFNLMVASQDLPDIIEYDLSANYPGGPGNALKEKVIIPLNDLIPKYAPNFKKQLEDKEVDRLSRLDDGTYFAFQMIVDRNDHYAGLYLRKDWLDELNMPVPTTIDEWYKTLTAFKEKMKATAPFSGAKLTSLLGPTDMPESFSTAYGVDMDFVLVDGKIKYAPIMPEYKAFLTTMKKWYAEGLIDADFMLNDAKAVDAKCTTGKAGAWMGPLGTAIGKYIATARATNPKYNVVAAPYPVLNKGDKAKLGQKSEKVMSANMTTITSSNKYPAETAKFLDFAYSDEGKTLYNWGIEGKSYVMENGKPKFTDEILKNPKYTPQQALVMYTKWNGPFPIDWGTRDQTTLYPEQADGYKIFATSSDFSRNMPPITLTPAEGEKYAQIMSQISTMTSEMTAKFILGSQPLDKFDQFVDSIKKLDIEEAEKIQQTAYERFMARK